MSSIRLGVYGLAILAAALVVGGVVGHSQALSSWQPANITAVDRGMAPAGIGLRRGLRARDHVHATDKIGRSGVPYRPGRLIVQFRDSVSAVARANAVSQVSRTASLGARQSAATFDIVNIDPAEDAEVMAAAFAARPDVEFAQPAYRLYTYAADSFVPNDQFYSRYQWNFPAIGLEQAWAIQQGASASIVVAIVDSGVAFQSGVLTRHAYAFCDADEFSATCQPGQGNNYPALGDITMPFAQASDLATSDSRFVSPYDFIWNTSTPLDLDGHGTHVAGTVGELTNNSLLLAGIAFNARLMPVKVIDTDWDDIFHSPNEGTDDTLALGIRYAADHGANVINMSIGRLGPSNCGNVAATGCAPLIESAVRYAVSKGCFVAIAAGNDGSTLPANEVEVLAEIASRVDGAVSVAALGRSNTHASYSTVGSYVELAAPGGDVNDYIYQQTYDPGFANTFLLPLNQYEAPRFDMLGGFGYQGTSMATPHVSGVAALLMQQGVKDPAAVEAMLEHFTTPCDAQSGACSSSVTPNRNNLTGFGEINARTTLRGLGLAK